MKKSNKLFCVFIICGVLTLFTAGCSGGDEIQLYRDNTNQTDNKSDEYDTSNKSENHIYIYVTGCVKKPGVYEVEDSARVFNVIELAGGFTKKAQMEYINLAEELKDGQCIHVMSKKEYEEEQKISSSKGNQESGDGLININSATESQLTTLPGVGTSKAAAIISYREEHGSFEQIEDIMQVPGIKEACFSNIKNLIKVK